MNNGGVTTDKERTQSYVIFSQGRYFPKLFVELAQINQLHSIILGISALTLAITIMEIF